MTNPNKDAPTKADEKARAKSENEANKAKQKLEKREAPQSHVDGDSGTDGGETFPSTTVVPSQPAPWENPDNAAMGERYTRKPKDAA